MVVVLAPTVRGQAIDAVDRAVAAAEAVRLGHWAYTRTRVVDGKSTVERHDPSAPAGKRWVIVELDGKAPTARELRRYAEERRHGGSGGTSGVRDLIEPGSLQVVGDDGERITCSFRMKADDEEERLIASRVRGTLVVRREGETVEMLELVNHGEVSKPGVLNLREFLVRVVYRRDPVRGDVLPETVRSKMRGRVLVVKSLNVDAQETYSDYRWVGP